MPPSFKFYTCSVGMFLILKHQDYFVKLYKAHPQKILQNRFHKQKALPKLKVMPM